MKKMVASRSYMKIGLAASTTSLVLQLLGFTCPGWIYISTDLSVIGATTGLIVRGFGQVVTESAVWFTRVCVHSDTYPTSGLCTASAGHDDWEMGLMLSQTLSDLRDINWLLTQVLLTFALIFCIVCIVVCAIKLCDVTTIEDRTMYGAAAVAILISGTLVLPPALSVGLAVGAARANAQTLSNSSGHQLIDTRLPWALLLSALGTVFSLISCLMFVVAAIKVKKEEFASSVFPRSYLSPAILKIGNFPATLSMSDRMGHAPPSLRTTGDRLAPPPIGTRDHEPFSLQNLGLDREDTFEPYVLFPPKKGQADRFMRPLGDTSPENSEPLPYHRFNHDSSEPHLPGSIALYSDAKDIKEDQQFHKLPPWVSPRALPKPSPKPSIRLGNMGLTSMKKSSPAGDGNTDKTGSRLNIPGQPTASEPTIGQTNKPCRSTSFNGQNKVNPAAIRNVASTDIMKDDSVKIANKPLANTKNKSQEAASKTFTLTTGEVKKKVTWSSTNNTSFTSKTSNPKTTTAEDSKKNGRPVPQATNYEKQPETLKASTQKPSDKSAMETNINKEQDDPKTSKVAASPGSTDNQKFDGQSKPVSIPTVKLDNTYCTYK